MGALLFIIYINDVLDVLDKRKVVLYAQTRKEPQMKNVRVNDINNVNNTWHEEIEIK